MFAAIIAFLLSNPLIMAALLGILATIIFGIGLGWLQATIFQLVLFFAGVFIAIKFAFPALYDQHISMERAVFIAAIAIALIYIGVTGMFLRALGSNAVLSIIP